MTLSDRRTSPLVTVLMAVYNGEMYLPEAIKSILAQTYTDFELLVIDDGSHGYTAAILEDYQIRDQRVRIEHNEANLGLTKSLNRGIVLAHGKYIARMDADDIALPERLARQVAFMEANEKVGVCGTWIILMGVSEEFVVKFPTKHNTIRCQLLFDNPLVHPTAIIRKEMFEKNNMEYDERFLQSQDYDLWVRCAERMTLANMPEPLLRLRKHEAQISNKFSSGQEATAWVVRKSQIERMGIEPTQDDLEIHRAICSQQISGTTQFVLSAERWLRKLLAANNAREYFSHAEFKEIICSYWMMLFSRSIVVGDLSTWWKFIASPVRAECNISIYKILLLLLKYIYKK